MENAGDASEAGIRHLDVSTLSYRVGPSKADTAYFGNVKVEVWPFRFSIVKPSEFVITVTW